MLKVARFSLLTCTLALCLSSYAEDYNRLVVVDKTKKENVAQADLAPQLSDFSSENIAKAKRSADDPFNDAAFGDLRIAAVKEAAYSLGMRNGLVARSLLIKAHLYQQRAELDRIFNFTPLLLDCGKEEVTRYTQKLIGERANENCLMQPPVILGAQNLLNDKNGQGEVLRFAKTSFRIKKQARLITTTPIWENYLIFDAGTPGNDVHPALYPKNDAERQAWDQALADGWLKGIEQANAIYRQNLAMLNEDYSGMQRYRYLLLQNLVSKPYVARNRLGITGNSKSAISIDDITLSITERPEFNLNASEWMLFPSF